MTRRTGDTVAIPGDYQYRALHSGGAIQRHWHRGKLDAALRLLSPQDGDHILDVGCGSGVLVGELAEIPGVRAIGVDANSDAIAFARRTYPAKNADFLLGLADELPIQDLAINKIAFLEILEHLEVEQAKRTLVGFRDLLPPRGRIVISTPNAKSLWPVVEWLMDRAKLAPQMDEEQHVSEWSPEAIVSLARAVGLEVRSVETLHLVAPWIAPLSRRVARTLAEAEARFAVRYGALVVATLEKL